MPKHVEVQHTKLEADEGIETSRGSKKIKQQLQRWKTLLETGMIHQIHRFLKKKPGEPGIGPGVWIHSNAAATQSNTDEELCDVCQTINFDAFFSLLCEEHRGRYMLGTVEDIQKRKSCAMCRLVAGSMKAGGYGGAQNHQCLCYLIHNDIDGHGIKVCLTDATSEREPGEGGGWQIIRKTIEHSKTQDGLSVMPLSSPNPNDYQYGTSYGRRMQSYQIDFDIIRGWLRSCETTHGDICKRLSLCSQNTCSIRLIDVMNRKLVDSTKNERYIALSYVWGIGSRFCLSRGNQEDLRSTNGLKDDDLPNTIRDVFEVVTGIGERFLWIDRLCILIDDELDKMDQMSKMDQIYSAAILTLVPASACCVTDHIAGVKPDTRQLVQHSENIRGVEYITTQPDLVSVLGEFNWSTRGWTYQEGFLSSRCLVFTPFQVYLQCKSETVCEDCSWVRRRQPPEPKIGNPLCQSGEYPVWFKPYLFRQHVDAVETFSARKLTVATDALWAFSGVTKAFEPQFLQGFIWGLPIDHLDAALLWRPRQSIDGMRPGLHSASIDSHTITLPFPSWSWASWGGAVSYSTKCEERVKSLVEWQPTSGYASDATEPLSSLCDLSQRDPALKASS